ncbi:MAG: metallophosphoesterase [Leptospira sp.]|nr:metallophosphoesterase [Leptospira sp.]
MKIIHISDLHFPTKLNPYALRKKSLIGYVNYAFRRRKKHQLYRALLESIQSMEYDCLIISGDITNISHPKEFQEARKILDPVLDERAFVIPGNHDRYTKESFEKSYFENTFGEFSGESMNLDEKGYLKIKKIKNLTLVGWDSNIPLPPMQAQGFVDLDVVKSTIHFLNQSNIQNYMVVCHHPIWNPKERQESERHRLLNRGEVLDLLKERPPIAFFHGHLHTNWVREPDEDVPFFVVNSASSTRDSDPRHESGYHIMSNNEKLDQPWKITRMVYSKLDNEFKEKEIINYKG